MRTRLGAAALLVGVAAFVVTLLLALNTAGTTYVWHLNLLSDLGDSGCRVRAGRPICSPGHVAFNVGLVVTGLLILAGGLGLLRWWGAMLGGGTIVMGAGLVIAGAFPAGGDGGVHLAGVVLALVVPNLALLASSIRPPTPWLASHRALRATLATIALLLCAESRLPVVLVPRGAGELVIVGALVVAMAFEAGRVLVAPRHALSR